MRARLLVDQRNISKSKQPVGGRGRPRFAYSVPVGRDGDLVMVPDP